MGRKAGFEGKANHLQPFPMLYPHHSIRKHTTYVSMAVRRAAPDPPVHRCGHCQVLPELLIRPLLG